MRIAADKEILLDLRQALKQVTDAVAADLVSPAAYGVPQSQHTRNANPNQNEIATVNHLRV